MDLKEYIQKPPKNSIAYFTNARPMYKPIERLFFKRSKKMGKFFQNYKIHDKKYLWEVMTLTKPKDLPTVFDGKLFHDEEDARTYVRERKREAKEMGMELVVFVVQKEATITEIV